MKRNQKLGIGIAAIALIVTGAFAAQRLRSRSAAPKPANPMVDNRTQITDEKDDMYKSVVLVNSVKKDEDYGTGYVVGKNSVATNRHVVMDIKDHPEEAIVRVGHKDEEGNVTFKEFKIKDIVMPEEETIDVAVLNLEHDADGKCISDFAKVAEFGNAETVKKGTELTVVGYPGDKDYGSLWASTGIVDMCEGGMISYNAKIAPGNSGSPMFDAEGKVVAMANAGGDDASYGFLTDEGIVSFIRENAK